MSDDRFTRVTISVDDPIELFRMHEFDPFTDDVDSVSSLAQLAQLPHLIKTIRTTELYILLPKERVTPQTQAQVRHALGRYCDHMVAEARRKLVALRWVGLRTMALGLVIFGIGLAASTAVGRLLWVPEGLRDWQARASSSPDGSLFGNRWIHSCKGGGRTGRRSARSALSAESASACTASTALAERRRRANATCPSRNRGTRDAHHDRRSGLEKGRRATLQSSRSEVFSAGPGDGPRYIG